jgi:DNA ligase-1
MTSDQIYAILEAIAADSSKTGKETAVRNYEANPEFKRVLVAALDPMVTYGLAKRPAAYQKHDNLQFDDITWKVLDDLASRRLSGTVAINTVGVELGRLTKDSAELFWRIISKDLRAGFSESTVNKAIPGLITTFECMLAHPFEAKRVKEWPQYVEPKLDGVRVLAFVDGVAATVRFFSRSGKEFTSFDHLKEPLIGIVQRSGFTNEFVFDAEVVSGDFNKTVGDVRRGSSQAVDAQLFVFDVLTLEDFKQDGKGGVGDPYCERRLELVAMIGETQTHSPIQLIPSYRVSNVTEIHSVYESVRSRGLEGLIVKDPKALYHRRRNHGWMKIKAEESVDVQIVDAIEGTGKYVGALGALVVDFKGVRVNVGSGFSDEQRKEFWDVYRNGACAEFRLVGCLIEVEYHEVTPDGSLRHPRFKRFRDDKPLKEAA